MVFSSLSQERKSFGFTIQPQNEAERSWRDATGVGAGRLPEAVGKPVGRRRVPPGWVGFFRGFFWEPPHHNVPCSVFLPLFLPARTSPASLRDDPGDARLASNLFFSPPKKQKKAENRGFFVVAWIFFFTPSPKKEK